MNSDKCYIWSNLKDSLFTTRLWRSLALNLIENEERGAGFLVYESTHSSCSFRIHKWATVPDTDCFQLLLMGHMLHQRNKQMLRYAALINFSDLTLVHNRFWNWKCPLMIRPPTYHQAVVKFRRNCSETFQTTKKASLWQNPRADHMAALKSFGSFLHFFFFSKNDMLQLTVPASGSWMAKLKD